MGQTLEYLLKLTDQFSGPMRHARDEQGKFVAGARQMAGASGNINTLGNAFVGLAAKIGAAFTAYKALEAGMSGFKHALSAASSMETTQTAFKTMLGSQEAMLKTLGDIKKLAMETPFEFPELAQAGRMLLAFGETAKDIPDTLRRIGDVSSAVAAPIGEIAEIYGKARTQGTLFAEDINQLTGRGIPIIREFAAILKIPQGEVKKLAEEGKITFPLLDQAFRNLTSSGGQFFGMMAEQAKTSAGLWSTLKDGVNDLFLALGTPLNDAIKPVLTDAIGLADQLKPAITELGMQMGGALTAVRDFIAEAKEGSGLAATMGAKLKEAFAGLADMAMIPLRAIGAGLPGIGKAMLTLMQPAGEWMMAKLESSALLFGRVLMRQMATVMASLPKWLTGDAASTLNKAANDAGKQGNLANERAKQAGADLPGAASAASGYLGEGMTAMRSKYQAEIERKTQEAKDQERNRNPYALPPSVLDQPAALAENQNNLLFPGGALPASAKGLKDVLPPSILNVPPSFFEKAQQSQAASAGVTPAGNNKSSANGIDAAIAAAKTVGSPAARARSAVDASAATARATMSADNGIDAGMTGRGRGVGAGALGQVRGLLGMGEEGSSETPEAATGRTTLARRVARPSLLDAFRRDQARDGSAATAFGANGLSGRRATPTVPSPGTARRSQERREAAAAGRRQQWGTPADGAGEDDPAEGGHAGRGEVADTQHPPGRSA